MVNIMDQKRCPGDFILDIAATGLKATAALSRFGTGYRIKNIYNSLSLSAGLLTEVGRITNEHETFFKDNFKLKFEAALAKCKKEYEKCITAVEKAQNWKKDESDADATPLPKGAWRKLAWGLGMTVKEFSDFEDELDESYKVAMMAQIIVQLVILQVHAQQRELTTPESMLLRRVKKEMGSLLQLLRKSGVGSVMIFSLADPSKVANATQVAKAAAEDDIEDNASITDSITIRNPSIAEIPPPPAKQFGPPGPPPPSLPPIVAPDIFELHRAMDIACEKKAKQTIFRFLGVPLSINRTETEVVSRLDKMNVPQDDIKALLENHKEEISKQPMIDALNGLPAATSLNICGYLGTKTDTRTFQSHTWSLAGILPLPAEGKPRRFWRKKDKTPDRHMVVFKGISNAPRPRPRPGPPPPPPGFRNSPIVVFPRRPRSVSSSLKRGKGMKFELSQQETENVINDYLATFSVLYDGVSVEDRGRALKEIILDEKHGSDSDSDSSDSGSSRSLVDD